MPVRTPTLDDLARLAAARALHLTDQDLLYFQEAFAGIVPSLARLDQLAEPRPPITYPRTPGYRPAPEENPQNAWYWRTEITGKPGGPLTGKTVALKDAVCLAGVPMMNGTSLLEGYVPDIDATIVTRILDAGGTILGKAVCEHLSLSGGSDSSATGTIPNPHDPTCTTGGSSSGSAALVAAGAVDVAIGCDQGGSIRIPASWCGIYGLKPTYGLVPYTGIFPIDHTLDHAGPMARTVLDLASLLEAIAGPDELDPRQVAGLEPQPYVAALTGSVRGLRIGLVREGFGWEGFSEPEVDAAVREAAHSFERLGGRVEEVSIPWHLDGVHLLIGIIYEGGVRQVLAGNTMGTGWKGFYLTSLINAFSQGRLSHADDLSDVAKSMLLAGDYLQQHYHGYYYARSQNLARSLRDAYDEALRRFDLLVMPTVPMRAKRLPAPDASRAERTATGAGLVLNTGAFDVTGHPALSVPCAIVDGLPIGMMLVGRFGDDATVLRAGHAFEQHIYAAPSPASR